MTKLERIYEETLNEQMLNEKMFNIDKEKLQQAINTIAPKIQANKIIQHAKSFMPFVKKFTNSDGSVNMDNIPFMQLKENIFSDFADWYENDGDWNSKKQFLGSMLKKVFLFPAWFISETIRVIIKCFQGGDYTISGILTLLLAMFITLIGFLGTVIYKHTEHGINGIDNGIVISKPYRAELDNIRKIRVQVGDNIFHIPNNNIHIWSVDVKDVNSDRTEQWITTDENIRNTVVKGDTININDYTWVENKNR